MSTESHNKRIAKNTIILYVRMIVAMFVGLFTSRIILKFLGAEDFGLYSVVGAVVATLSILISSLSTASSRFITVELGKGDAGSLNRTFSTTVNIHGLLAAGAVLILLIVGPMVLSSWINIPADRIGAVAFSFKCIVATVALSIVVVPFNALIVAHERMSAFAWMSIVDVVARLGIAYALKLTPYDNLKTYALLIALIQVLYLLINMGYSFCQFRSIRYIRCWDARLLRDIFTFAGWSLLTSVAVILCSQCVTVLNQRYFGATLVAAFALAMTVQSQVLGFISNFKMAANPQIIKSFASGLYAESKKLLLDAATLSICIFLVLAVPMFVFADRILDLWLESVPLHTVTFVRIVLVTALFSILDTSFYTALYASGRLQESVLINICSGIIIFFVIWVVILWTHFVFTASIFLCLWTMFIGCLAKPFLLIRYVGYTRGDIMSIFVPMSKVIVLAGFIGLVTHLITPDGLIAMCFGGMLCVGGVILTCWFVGLDYERRKYFLTVLKRKFPVLERVMP